MYRSGDTDHLVVPGVAHLFQCEIMLHKLILQCLIHALYFDKCVVNTLRSSLSSISFSIKLAGPLANNCKVAVI